MFSFGSNMFHNICYSLLYTDCVIVVPKGKVFRNYFDPKRKLLCQKINIKRRDIIFNRHFQLRVADLVYCLCSNYFPNFGHLTLEN